MFIFMKDALSMYHIVCLYVCVRLGSSSSSSPSDSPGISTNAAVKAELKDSKNNVSVQVLLPTSSRREGRNRKYLLLSPCQP